MGNIFKFIESAIFEQEEVQQEATKVEQPQPAMLPYLRRQAAAGKVVIVTSTDSSIIAGADNVVETAR